MNIKSIIKTISQTEGFDDLQIDRASIDFGKTTKVITDKNRIESLESNDFKLALIFISINEIEGIVIQLKKGKVNYLKFWEAIIIEGEYLILESNNNNLIAEKFELYYADRVKVDKKQLHTNLSKAMKSKIINLDSMLGKLLLRYNYPISILKSIESDTYIGVFKELESNLIAGDISKYTARIINYISLELEEIKIQSIETNKRRALLNIYKAIQPMIMNKERLELTNVIDTLEINKLKSIINLLRSDLSTKSRSSQ